MFNIVNYLVLIIGLFFMGGVTFHLYKEEGYVVFVIPIVFVWFLYYSKKRPGEKKPLPFEDRVITRDDFADVNMYKSLAAYSKDGVIKLSDFHERGQIDLRDSKIKSIAGIEIFSILDDMENLLLSKNKITDLWPLINLPKLKNLNVYYNGLSDLAPLSGLGNLEKLQMENNEITDIRPLSELKNLRVLNIVNNKIRDLSILSGLTLLDTLYVDGNPARDLSPIASLTGLKHLGVSKMVLTDLSFLANLRELESLDIRDNRISDISVLRGLENLKNVMLDGNCIKDMSPADHVMELEGQGEQRKDCEKDGFFDDDDDD